MESFLNPTPLRQRLWSMLHHGVFCWKSGTSSGWAHCIHRLPPGLSASLCHIFLFSASDEIQALLVLGSTLKAVVHPVHLGGVSLWATAAVTPPPPPSVEGTLSKNGAPRAYHFWSPFLGARPLVPFSEGPWLMTLGDLLLNGGPCEEMGRLLHSITFRPAPEMWGSKRAPYYRLEEIRGESRNQQHLPPPPGGGGGVTEEAG